MTVNEKPVVHIIGMGSMGAIIAVNLLEHTQCEIVPLFRNVAKCERFVNEADSIITINKMYPGYEGENATVIQKIGRVYAPENYPKDEPIRNLIVATKTYQTQDAIRPFLPYINSETNLILVQNGLGVLEEIKEGIFAPETKQGCPQLFQGVIAHGAYQVSEFMFNHACDADFKIARLPWSHHDMVQSCELVNDDSSNNELLHLLTKPIFEKRFHVLHMTYQEMLIGQLFKFLLNSCINSVTAIVDALNEEVRDCCHATFSSIVEESISILKVVYQPLFDYEMEYNGKDGYPTLEVTKTFQLDPLVDSIIHLCCVVGGRNSTSMRQDTLNLRDTEINYINGFVVKMAERFNMGPSAAKVNKTIVQLVNLRSGLNRARAKKTQALI
ncbi:2-dehydropantoate 2-reductase (Ketopantoate reductase) (KPA reductase) (KPR) [Monosporozyma unispora]|nr:2-dehydropantoate 2-reductase (Ketopantoate reductase) (KPA reductase) (KPR) [Kazachstania unispora]